MKVRRLLVDVAADGCHGLLGVEPMKDGVGEAVLIYHFLGVLFRVDGKCHDLGPDVFEPFDALLKISQLLMAEASPLPSVEEHHIPARSEVVGELHSAAPDP